MGSDAAIPSFDLTADPATLRRGTDEWKLTGHAIREALETAGCIAVKHGGISGGEREEMLAAMRSLFELPVEVKRRNVAKESLTTYPGSNPFVPLYEAQGIMNPTELDRAKAFSDLMWPGAGDQFCKTIHTMSNKMADVLRGLLDILVDSYGVDPEDTRLVATDALFHMIMYRAPPTGGEAPALGLPEHKDVNYVTIIGQNDVEGLQVKTRAGDWVPVNLGTDQFVVLAGSSLQAWSNGRVHAPFHQVIFRGAKDRLSWTVFLTPKPDQTIDAAPVFVDDEHPRLYKPYVYGEFHEYTKVNFEGREFILEKYAGV